MAVLIAPSFPFCTVVACIMHKIVNIKYRRHEKPGFPENQLQLWEASYTSTIRRKRILSGWDGRSIKWDLKNRWKQRYRDKDIYNWEQKGMKVVYRKWFDGFDGKYLV